MTLTFLKTLLAALLVASSAAAQVSDYVLSEGDQVEFDLLDDDEEPRILTIAQDGHIQLPLIGAVELAGISVTAAMNKIRRTYIEGDLLIDPKVSLSIAAFRPVFVLGDVRQPGLVEFRPFLTVEQAIGLAGGLLAAAGDQQQHLLTEAALRGELNVVDEEITRQAATIARLRAQRAGDLSLSDDWLDPAIKRFVDGDQFLKLSLVELEILESDLAAIASDRAFLEEEIDTLERETELLREREVQQRSLVALLDEKLAQASELSERGLQTNNALTTAQSQFAEAEGSLLEISRRISEAERRSIEIKRELSSTSAATDKSVLNEIQDRTLEIQRLAARRASISERILLVAAWENDRTREVLSVESSFSIRRTVRGRTTEENADIVTRLTPGDVLIVRISLLDDEDTNATE